MAAAAALTLLATTGCGDGGRRGDDDAVPTPETTSAASNATSTSGSTDHHHGAWDDHWRVQEVPSEAGRTLWSQARAPADAASPLVRVRGARELADLCDTADLQVLLTDGCSRQVLTVSVRQEPSSRLAVTDVVPGRLDLADCPGPASGLELADLVEAVSASRLWTPMTDGDVSPGTPPRTGGLYDAEGRLRLVLSGLYANTVTWRWRSPPLTHRSPGRREGDRGSGGDQDLVRGSA